LSADVLAGLSFAGDVRGLIYKRHCEVVWVWECLGLSTDSLYCVQNKGFVFLLRPSPFFYFMLFFLFISFLFLKNLFHLVKWN
jgi:hypothetical protein